MKHHILSAIVDADVTALRVTLVMVALLFGTGLLMSQDGDTPAYARMYYLAPHYVWAGAFFAYGLGKLFVASLWPNKINRCLAIVIIALGLFLWSYVYFSFTADGSTPAEYMMLALIICEIWIGAHTLSGGKNVD